MSLADSNNDGIPNLAIRHDDTALIIDSQGYPNHPTAIFPNSRNPNRIRVQSFHFRLPLEPKRAPSITRVPMGPIGMALNGVVFFNPFVGCYAGVPEPSNNRMLRRGTTGAIVDNADRTAVKVFGIRSVLPGNASRGQTHTLQFALDPSTRGGVPEGVPSWVQVGPFEASKVTRQGNTVTAEVAIAADAPVGVLLDAHIEFGVAGGRGSGVVRVLKKNDAFRVVP